MWRRGPPTLCRCVCAIIITDTRSRALSAVDQVLHSTVTVNSVCAWLLQCSILWFTRRLWQGTGDAEQYCISSVSVTWRLSDLVSFLQSLHLLLASCLTDTFKVLSCPVQAYLSDMIHTVELEPSNHWDLPLLLCMLPVPRSSNGLVRCAFSVVAPAVWNITCWCLDYFTL